MFFICKSHISHPSLSMRIHIGPTMYLVCVMYYFHLYILHPFCAIRPHIAARVYLVMCYFHLYILHSSWPLDFTEGPQRILPCVILVYICIFHLTPSCAIKLHIGPTVHLSIYHFNLLASCHNRCVFPT